MDWRNEKSREGADRTPSSARPADPFKGSREGDAAPSDEKAPIGPLQPTVVYVRDTAGRRRRALIRIGILLGLLAAVMFLAYLKRSSLAKTLGGMFAPNTETQELLRRKEAQALVDAMREELTIEDFKEPNRRKVKALFERVPAGGPHKSQAEILWRRGECKALGQQAKGFEEKEDWARAADLLAKAAEFDRSDLDIQRRLRAGEHLAQMKECVAAAQDHARKGEREKALVSFEMAIEEAKQTSHPKAAEYRNAATKLLEQIKQHDQRITRDREAEEQFKKGNFEAEAKILEELARVFEADYSDKAKNAELLSRGLAASARKDHDLALRYLSQIPESDRHYKKALEALTEIKQRRYFETKLASAEKLLYEGKIAEAMSALKELQALRPNNYDVEELQKQAEAIQGCLSEARKLRQEGKCYEAMQKCISIKKRYADNPEIIALCDSEIKSTQTALLDLMRKAAQQGGASWTKYRETKTQVDERDIYRIEGSWDAFTRLSALLAEAYTNLNTARSISVELKLPFANDAECRAAEVEITELTKKLFAIAYQHENVIRNKEIARAYYRAVVQLPHVEKDEYWSLAGEKLKAYQAPTAPPGTK